MRISRLLAGLVASVGLFGTALFAQRAAQPSPTPTKFYEDDASLISWVCTATGDESVMEDGPGTCPHGGARIPIRTQIAYACLKVAMFSEQPGRCPADGSEMGPVTVSKFWTCGSDPTHHINPDPCADGSAPKKEFEIRPHGDHRPRHGGASVYMLQSDLTHHLEATLVAPNIVRVYFYNEFTKPMPATGFTGAVTRTDSNGKEVGTPIPLVASKTNNSVMEAAIPGLPAPTKNAQIYLKLHVKIKPTAPDWPTDQQFSEYSKEPPGGTAAPTSTGASAKPPVAPGRGTQTAAASGARPPIPTPKAPAAKPPAAKPAAPKPAPAPVESPTGGAMAGSSSPDLSGAGFAAQEVLPDTTPELLAMLKTKRDEVQQGLDDGQLGGVWLPALSAKDVAIALEENHSRDLPDGKRPSLSAAVKQITVTAWQIDAAGDLGNKDKLLDLNKVFSAAADDIESLYASAK